MGQRILLIHAADTKALAQIAERRLSGLDCEVERRGLDQIKTAGRDADRVILLWSRAAAAEKLLKRVDAPEKFCVVRLASSPTPPRLGASTVTLPRPGDGDGPWLALAGLTATKARAPAHAGPTHHSGNRWHGLLVALAMAAVTAWASSVANPGLVQTVIAALAG